MHRPRIVDRQRNNLNDFENLACSMTWKQQHSNINNPALDEKYTKAQGNQRLSNCLLNFEKGGRSSEAAMTALKARRALRMMCLSFEDTDTDSDNSHDESDDEDNMLEFSKIPHESVMVSKKKLQDFEWTLRTLESQVNDQQDKDKEIEGIVAIRTKKMIEAMNEKMKLVEKQLLENAKREKESDTQPRGIKKLFRSRKPEAKPINCRIESPVEKQVSTLDGPFLNNINIGSLSREELLKTIHHLNQHVSTQQSQLDEAKELIQYAFRQRDDAAQSAQEALHLTLDLDKRLHCAHKELADIRIDLERKTTPDIHSTEEIDLPSPRATF